MATPKKKSLFAQRMQNSKESKRLKKTDDQVASQPSMSLSLGEKSNLVQGPEAEAIHQENLAKIASMTPSEIEEQRQKLLSSLDPTLIEFLKSKRAPKNVQRKHESSNSAKPDSNKMDLSNIPVPTIGTTPATQLVNKYPHMDVVEPEKLQWMEDVPSAKPLAQGCPYNARFNFDGELLPFSDDQVANGLHHHGEEPNRPGYTLQELMQLSRSSMLQQRVTAISTLANIFNKTSDYDYCLEKPLLPQLLDSELYLLLRFTLDDPVRSVVSTAIAAISNLLVNIKDEGCMDRLLGLSTGLRQPSFYVDLDLKPNELAELKDTELLKVDVVRGALRTHLLPRLRYILDKLEPDSVEIMHIMRCLIRVARHSYESALSIINEPGLLKAVRNLLNDRPPRACSDAMKLFRVIACQSLSIAAHLEQQYSLVHPIQRFIAGDGEESNMSLSLESFYTWQTFLTYNLTTTHISTFSPVIQRLLVTYVDNIGLDSGGGDLEHASALVSWVTCVFRVDLQVGRIFIPVLQVCANKWLSQVAQTSSIKWAACKLLEATLHALATLLKLQDFKNSEIQRKIEKLLSSDGFIHLCQKLKKSSWLLHGEKSPSVVDILPCLGSIPPTLYDESPLPLVMGLAMFVFAINSPQLSEVFVSAEGLQQYLEEVITGGVRVLTSHWFARQELALIYMLLQVHLNTNRSMDSSLIHKAALFLSTSIHSDDRYMLPVLFDEIIFNKQFFSTDTNDIVSRLQELELTSSHEESSERTQKLLNKDMSKHSRVNSYINQSLTGMCQCYKMELGLEGLVPSSPPPTLTASHRGTDPALPADWHFLPLVHLNNTEDKREDAVSVALCCLQWSVVLEMTRPSFVANLSAASRYCRLACVLLAGNDLFQDVQECLRESLEVLLLHNTDMEFEKPITGLSSFYDFYRQILEQFVGVSYGNPVFGTFVLIPLQQRHSTRLRKLVWCEMAAVLRFLSTPVDQIGISLDNFLEPCETDLDLLYIYLKGLAQGRVRESFCPVLYRVAVHHVATFVCLYADQPAAKQLGQMIEALGNQDLKSLLTSYCISKTTVLK